MTTIDDSKDVADESSVAWWNPLHWPAAIWLLLITFVVMSIPFAIRTIMLAAVPDIPEPFDVAAFSKWDVTASDDAFTDYRQAVALHQQLLADLKLRGDTDTREPEDYQIILEKGWSEASDSAKTWLELHQESLTVWRRGTEKEQGLNLAPSNLSFTTTLNVVQDQRMFVRLAMLAEARSLSEGKLEEAYQWARAAFRAGGHTSHRGPMIQSLVGIALQTVSSRGIARWAEQSEVTSQQLRQALIDVRTDYGLYELPSNILKAEYLGARNTLQSPTWYDAIDPMNSGVSNSMGFAKAMRLFYWVIGEPEVTLRIYRQILANQLQEIDKPVALRRKTVGAGVAMLFDPDPKVPRPPGQLDPAGIDRAIKRSSLTRLLLPAMRTVDIALLRQQALQATLEVLLAAQAYRRDHGEFPENLDQLIPQYLTAIPSDPCNPAGGPVLYRRDEPTKAIIWSMGDDQADGGGVIEIPNARAPDVGFELR